MFVMVYSTVPVTRNGAWQQQATVCICPSETPDNFRQHSEHGTSRQYKHTNAPAVD